MEGEIHKIKVGEHFFETPPEPRRKAMLFHDLPKAEQYWRRQTDFPKFFFDWHRDVQEDSDYTTYEGKLLKTLSREDTEMLIELRDREYQRMTEGVWFLNNGEATYITGGHYFALQHGAMKGSKNGVEARSKYGQYMQFQRDYCYFIEIVKTSNIARGGDVVKPKKTGITQLQALLILCDAMLNRTSLYRMMSTKEEVAKSSCFDYIAYAVANLPPVMTPSIGKQNMGEILFSSPDGTRGRRNKAIDVDHYYLDTTISTVPTIKNAFDSLTNRVAWIDEQSKIKDGAYPQETHDITIVTVMQGFDRYGYVIYTHYVSETNDRSFHEARKIYYDSKLKTVDPATGMTLSKLLCFALTVLDGVFGACDKYGKPDTKKIWAEINSQHAALKDKPNALQAYKRQYPVTEDDCWQIGAGEASIFDNIRLGAKDKELEIDESSGVFPYKDFNFEWSKPPQADEINNIYKFEGHPIIKWVSDEDKASGKPHGLFKWYRKEWTPDWWLKKHLYRYGTDKKGKLKPHAECPFYAAVDPTNYSDKTDVVAASKNAVQVFIMPDGELDGFFGKRVTNKRLMVEYLHRPNSPMDTLMHVVQVILTFGCYILIESNMGWLYNKLKAWGFGNFLIVMNKDGALEPYTGAEGQKPFTSQKATIGLYVNAGKIHLGQPETEMDIDNIQYLDSRDVIFQLMSFDSDDTRRFDAAVCYLEAQYGMDSYLGWRQKMLERKRLKTSGMLTQITSSFLG